MSWQDFQEAPIDQTPAAAPAWQGYAEAPAEQSPATPARDASAIPSMAQIERWMTFGLSDKAGALGAAMGASLPGSANPGNFWDTYSKYLDKARQEAKDYTESHPIANVAGTVAGGMLGAPLAKGASFAQSLGDAVIQGMKGGATVGGLAGAGNAEPGHELAGGTEGAAGGAAFGATLPFAAELARPVLEGFKQSFPSLSPNAAANAALARISQRIQQDVRAGGPGISEMQSALVPGKPLSIADVGGENVQSLAGNLARTPGATREAATNFFNSRDAGAGSRLISDIDQHISSGGSAYTAIDDLMRQRAAAARPMYEKALATNGPVISDRLQQFLDEPILRQGLAQGVQIQRLEALAQGKKFDPNDYTMSYDVVPSGPITNGVPPTLEGVPRFTATPNMRTLDAGKRGLDNMLDQYRDPTTGRLNLDQRGNAINQVRAAYIDELDKLNPDYAAARQAWSGPSQSMDAIRRGQNFQQMRPEEIQKQIATMPQGDRDFFLAGVADKLRQDVQRTAINGDEAKRLVNSQYVQNQLRPLFDTQSAYDQFIRSVTAERTMFGTKQSVLGGSQTAARIAEDNANTEGGPAMRLLAGGLAMKGGEPFLGASMLLRGAKDAYGRLTQPSAATQTEMAKRLFSPDLLANQQTLNALQPQTLASKLPPWLLEPGAQTFGMLSPAIMGGSGQ